MTYSHLLQSHVPPPAPRQAEAMFCRDFCFSLEIITLFEGQNWRHLSYPYLEAVMPYVIWKRFPTPPSRAIKVPVLPWASPTHSGGFVQFDPE